MRRMKLHTVEPGFLNPDNRIGEIPDDLPDFFRLQLPGFLIRIGDSTAEGAMQSAVT